MAEAAKRATEPAAATRTASDTEVVDFLNAARKTIDMHGWRQHTFGNVDVGFCTDGALQHVLQLWGHDWLPVFFTARRMVELAIDGHVIGPWNDVFGRTVQQVDAAYQRAIHNVRAGALS